MATGAEQNLYFLDLLWLSFLGVSFVYKVKARGRAVTLNGSGQNRTKQTAERGRGQTNSSVVGQNRWRHGHIRDVGRKKG